MDIKQLAELAGVSIATVSRVINDKKGVRPDVRERIKALVKEHHYRPNQLARGLVSKRSRVIGLLVPRVLNFYEDFVEAALSTCHSNEYSVMIASAFARFEGEVDNFYLMYEKQVEGIIYYASKVSDKHRAAMKTIGRNIPVVAIDYEPEANITMSCILNDNYSGARMAMEYLIEQGHHRIACIGGPQYHTMGLDRTKAYHDVMREHGLPVESGYLTSGDYDSISGEQCMISILNTSSIPPTAVFSANDQMVYGAVKALSDRNISVPDDISFVGYDDNSLSAFFHPGITTIRQDRYHMGKIAAHILLEEIRNPQAPKQRITLQHELIQRESVRRLEDQTSLTGRTS
ncbi:MAG: LacI family transcriptional regulator [Spartobacteria bacterium]|nr:LacI family transcriptional regulator [Spartobacteria bacterium]